MDNKGSNSQDTSNQTQAMPFLLHPSMFPVGIITPRMLVASPVVAKGDMYYSKDGVDFIRLPATVGGTMTIQAGAPSWLLGFTGTVTIPKITTATGSLTVVNGIITAVVQPT